MTQALIWVAGLVAATVALALSESTQDFAAWPLAAGVPHLLFCAAALGGPALEPAGRLARAVFALVTGVVLGAMTLGHWWIAIELADLYEAAESEALVYGSSALVSVAAAVWGWVDSGRRSRRAAAWRLLGVMAAACGLCAGAAFLSYATVVGGPGLRGVLTVVAGVVAGGLLAWLGLCAATVGLVARARARAANLAG